MLMLKIKHFAEASNILVYNFDKKSTHWSNTSDKFY